MYSCRLSSCRLVLWKKGNIVMGWSNLNLKHTVGGTEPCECDNCEWTGLARETAIISDPDQRLKPNDPIPAGECPECGALAYACEEKKVLIILIDEIGTVVQLKRRVNESELNACTRGELTILRVENGNVQEMNSMVQSEWTDLEEKG